MRGEEQSLLGLVGEGHGVNENGKGMKIEKVNVDEVDDLDQVVVNLSVNRK